MNDVSILWAIVIILLGIGAVVPIVQSSFSGSSSAYDTDVTSHLQEVAPQGSNALDVLAYALGSLLAWSFGINIWINILILEPMRIVFYTLIYRLVRSGGG